jgi:hypothetical protein
MTLKRMLVGLAVLLLAPLPSTAGSFGIYGSHWDSDEADSSLGAGVRIGFSFVKFLELEFHGTRFSDFQTDVLLQDVDIRATPVDGGLRVNFLPALAVNPYAGAGVSYFFLESDQGAIDDETGWYAEAGLDFGGRNGRIFVEAMWRKIDTQISLGVFDADARFDGTTVNAGFLWRWGR